MDLSTYQRFGDVIKAIREKESLTQRGLAKMLDVSPGYVGQWECGLSKPSADIIKKICILFEMDNEEEQMQRIAYAETAPTFIKQSIFTYAATNKTNAQELTACEAKIISLVRKLPGNQLPLVIQKLEAWVNAFSSMQNNKQQ